MNRDELVGEALVEGLASAIGFAFEQPIQRESFLDFLDRCIREAAHQIEVVDSPTELRSPLGYF